MTATAKKTSKKIAAEIAQGITDAADIKKTTNPVQDVATSVVTVELVNIEGMLPVKVFTSENIQEFLSRIEKEKNDFVAPDATTPAGRKAIVSFANRFTKTKTAVDDLGKDYVAVLKDEPKRIDALRKLFRDTLDQWHEEVRRPVTLLEDADKKRKDTHEKHLKDIGDQLMFMTARPSSAEVQRRIDFIMVFQQRNWEEFDELYQTTYKAVSESLAATLVVSKQAEADAAELVKLRASQAKALEDARVEQARIDGIAEGQRLASIAPAAPAAQSAVAAPIVSQPQSAGGYASFAAPKPSAPIKDEAKALINREVLADLMAYGCKEDGAKALIKAIVTGTIRHVTINYGA